MIRQLWTVEVVDFMALASTVVPPIASITFIAFSFMVLSIGIFLEIRQDIFFYLWD